MMAICMVKRPQNAQNAKITIFLLGNLFENNILYSRIHKDNQNFLVIIAYHKIPQKNKFQI